MSNTLLFSLLFSIIGMGYFAYGRKNHPSFLIGGLALMLYPYFVSTTLWLIILGILFMLLPFVFDI